jgi:NADPH-dependent dioxygenase
MLGDAQVVTDLPRNSIYWVRTVGVTMMMVPLQEPGRWRMLDTAAAGRSDDPDVVGARFTELIGSGIGGRFEVSRPTWVSRFTFQQRMIERMRVGRCLLAGDAAHVHSPASGQGMNTGIQEAFNLAWKLAMVVHGQADESILDTYTTERVPVGETLLATTKRATRMIQLRNPIAERLLPVLFAVVRNVTAVRRKMQQGFLGGVSGLNLAYTGGPLTQTAADAPQPRPGERVTQVLPADATGPGWATVLAELRGTRWVLLALPTPGAAPPAHLDRLAELHGGWLSVCVPPEDAGLRRALGAGGAAWLLVRPDAYVAARGAGLEQHDIFAAIRRIPLTDGATGPVEPTPTEGASLATES